VLDLVKQLRPGEAMDDDLKAKVYGRTEREQEHAFCEATAAFLSDRPRAVAWQVRTNVAGTPGGAYQLDRSDRVVAGCAATGDAGREAATQLQQNPGKAEDFMIVDCLLPGQIRRLGAEVTFLTARRAIKTSTRDCEIRGGEYVAFDRSNYATALKIWLPLAKEGDASAQTYVGEIFEKGLGVPPDHAAAAEWYRRAAESGYSP